jgi:hypothetical protein
MEGVSGPGRLIEPAGSLPLWEEVNESQSSGHVRIATVQTPHHPWLGDLDQLSTLTDSGSRIRACVSKVGSFRDCVRGLLPREGLRNVATDEASEPTGSASGTRGS